MALIGCEVDVYILPDGNYYTAEGIISSEDVEIIGIIPPVWPFTEDELHEIGLALHLCTTSDRTKPLIEKVTRMIIELRNKKL